jgi:hypothetical protein
MKIHIHIKFFICFAALIFYHLFAKAQNIDFGKSYINVTKGTNGGTIEPGDTLEIRAAFVVRSGTYDSCAYYDAVPTGTTYIANTIRVLTNEGKIYKQFTDAQWDDQGWLNGSNIRINLGYNGAAAPATAYRRGRVINTHRPSFYGGTCIMIASFRVRVTAALGSTISTGGGSMTYKSGAAAIQTFTFPANTLAVYTNIGMCPNLVGVNALGTESNGTFGSGKPRYRGTSANVPPSYTYNMFTTNMPNDYYYGIANNTSVVTAYTTSNAWMKPDPDPDGAGPLTTHRVFTVWDIIGDHTGAVSPTAGNPAADTVNNNNGGYMLVINASYRIDSAFQQTISGLCPNTYYEISCWMRNICSRCGCDSAGRGAGTAGYIPTAPGDSSGVYPNLTFEVDGIDYYTSGNILYNGQWIRKGFTFLTGASQTSFTLKFFNNAPGGGGNDWALDDISVATCYPNLAVTPSPVFTGCSGNLVDFGAVVRSFFNNYTQYKWQRSTNGGSSWSDAGVSGTGSPVLSGGQYEYTVNYPSFIGNMSDSGNKYRLVVATTVPNLNDPNCSFVSATDITTLNILDCAILPVQLVSWDGQLKNNLAELKWITNDEQEPITYVVEKSTDGTSFSQVGMVPGTFGQGQSGSSVYTLTDPIPVSGLTYYRLKIVSGGGNDIRYSGVILLSNSKLNFEVKSVINPFRDNIRVDLYAPEDGPVEFKLFDIYGKMVAVKKGSVEKGFTTYTLDGVGNLSKGVYNLNIRFKNQQFNKKIVKQ